MREIKFRGNNTFNNRWEYGSLVKEKDGALWIIPEDQMLMSEGGSFSAAHVSSKTVGQFSTLRDKNGKEIYAGDILKAGEEKDFLEVRFVRGIFAFLWNGDLDNEFPCNAPTHEWATVVGNIHDNPEMIKRKNE